MPTFLRGVSIHPSHQTQHPISFDDQFSDITPFTHNVTVSLDFPTIISLATTRFFRKCFATAQAGHTVIFIGGFRDKPSNRKIRNRLSRISTAAHHHAHILLTFPSNTFPAGTVRGWPESPDDDHHQHNQFSLHERFGVPTQPTKMNPHMVQQTCLSRYSPMQYTRNTLYTSIHYKSQLYLTL